MAEAFLSPERDPLEETGRKRTASEANDSEHPDGSPDSKKVALDTDPLEDPLGLGEYPHNTRRTNENTEHLHLNPPQAFGYNDFEREFGHYDEGLFVNQQEAEELLATLESLAGRLSTDTQPLPLEYHDVPMLGYEYPPMLGWSQDTGTITTDTGDKVQEKAENMVINIKKDRCVEDRSN